MRILVTGASGFIGKHLIAALVHDPLNSVVCFGKHIEAWKNDEWLDVKKFAPEIVYHLASWGNEPTQTFLEKIYSINVSGMANLLTWVPKNCRFVFASSSSVYGRRLTPMNERDTLYPTSHYAISKMTAENMLLKELPSATVLRLFSVYGEGEADYRLIPTLKRQVAAKEKVILASTKRDFIHVRDVVKAFLHFTNKPGIFNVGTGHQSSLEDIFGILWGQHLMYYPGGVKLLSESPRPLDWESSRWESDQMKSYGAGWQAEISLEKGLLL